MLEKSVCVAYICLENIFYNLLGLVRFAGPAVKLAPFILSYSMEGDAGLN